MNPNVSEAVSTITETASAQSRFDDEHQNEVGRRTFCNELLLTSAALVVGTAIAPTETTAQEALLAYPPTKIEGAEKLIVGSSLYFYYPTRTDPAVLLRLSDGEYSAFSRKCSHAGCSVEVDKAGRCLKCPCHRGMFDARAGYVMYGPPQRPLDQIVLQMRAGGEVWAVGKRIGNNPEKFAQGRNQSNSSPSEGP
jgi:Rieske Fe-S protein